MGSASDIGPFPVRHVSEVSPRRKEEAWLIEGLWAQRAVGVIGGVPKCCLCRARHNPHHAACRIMPRTSLFACSAGQHRHFRLANAA